MERFTLIQEEAIMLHVWELRMRNKGRCKQNGRA